MKICFATNNANKLSELNAKMPASIQLLSLKDIGCNEELPETGTTLHFNAHEKAEYVAEKYGINCFADDTGLEVTALNGEPGVYSARYAGPACDSSENIRKVLGKMAGQTNRSAFFRTVVCLIYEGKAKYFEGEVKGMITESITGARGFGYDPIFKPLGFDTTFAQMSMEQKNAISHRGKAVEQLINFFESTVKEQRQ